MASPPPLSGRVAIITGASRGIGRQVALHLHSLGAKVILNYASSSAQADQLAAQLSSNAVAVRANISDANQVKLLYLLVQKHFSLTPHRPSLNYELKILCALPSCDSFDRSYRHHFMILVLEETLVKELHLDMFGFVSDIHSLRLVVGSDFGSTIDSFVDLKTEQQLRWYFNLIRCCDAFCKWMMRASRVCGRDLWIVRKYVSQHTCPRDIISNEHRQANGHFVGEILKWNFSRGIFDKARPKDVMSYIRDKHGVEISYYVASKESQATHGPRAPCCSARSSSSARPSAPQAPHARPNARGMRAAARPSTTSARPQRA